MQRRIRAIGIGIILLMLLCLNMPAQAASPYALTIDYHVGDARTAIDGATFDVVMVASRDASGNSYTLVDPFTGSDVNPNAVGADVKAAATSLQAIYAEAVAQAAAGATGTAGTAGQTVPQAVAVTTDANGYASLGIDTAGLYLIWQDGSTGTASQYYEAAPMLVYVPTVNDDGTTWQNTITIEPKTSRRPTDDGGDHGSGDDGSNTGGSDDGGSGSSDSSSNTPQKPAASDTGTTIPKGTDLPTEEQGPGITEITGNDQTGDGTTGEGSGDGSGAGFSYTGKVNPADYDDVWRFLADGGSYGDWARYHGLPGYSDYGGLAGGFAGDNSRIRIYGAVAIFALIVLVAHFLKNRQK